MLCFLLLETLSSGNYIQLADDSNVVDSLSIVDADGYMAAVHQTKRPSTQTGD